MVSADTLEVCLEVEKPMPDVTVRFSEVLEIGLKNWDWDPRLGSNGFAGPPQDVELAASLLPSREKGVRSFFGAKSSKRGVAT